MKYVKDQLRVLFWLTTACLFLAGAGWSDAQELRDRDQLILLRNGRVLEGKLRQNLDHWTVFFDSGASLRLESRDIDLLGDSMTHLYQQMQQRADRAQMGERIEIVHFCLRHQLLDDAQNEIAWLVQDGISPDISQRLEASLLALRRKTQLDARRAMEGPEVQQASNIEEEPEAHPVTSADYPMASDDDSGVKQADFIEDEFSTFVRKVQPHLLIGCSQALCHGTQGPTDFVFERLELGATPTRKMSQANYFMLKKWLRDFGEEQLLEMARSTHGGMREPVWNSESAGLRVVEQWTQQVHQTPTLPKNATSGSIKPAQYLQNGAASKAASEEGGPSPYDPELFHRYVQRQAENGEKETTEPDDGDTDSKVNQPSTERPEVISTPPRSRSKNK